jgi:hypothetical protein
MSHALAGRPPAHLAARLARHVAPDLRIAASRFEWIMARPLATGVLQQRVSRLVRAAAAAAALARPARRDMPGFTLPSWDNPAPRTFWWSSGQTSDDILLQESPLRRDAARALKALKGLPAALAFLDADGAWLLDADGRDVLEVGRPPVGEACWIRSPPRILPEPSDLARRLHDHLPAGRTDLPPVAQFRTAHARLHHGLDQTAVQTLSELFSPRHSSRIRIHHTPRLLVLLRLTPDGHALPVLLASFP